MCKSRWKKCVEHPVKVVRVYFAAWNGVQLRKAAVLRKSETTARKAALPLDLAIVQ
jgi:hypothetical protein